MQIGTVSGSKPSWFCNSGNCQMQPSFENADVGTSDALSSTSAELPSARFVWSLRLICAAALGISMYLAWTAFSMGTVFGCSGGDLIDCEHVLTSHWSKVMGVPVSVPAAGLYASLIALLAFARKDGPNRLRQLVWGGMTLGSVMAGLAAMWFIGLQVFEFKFCPYCLVVHTCGIILTGTMLASRFCPLSLKLKSASVSVIGISALVGIQVATPKADHFELVHYDDVVPTVSGSADAAVDVDGMEVFEAPVDVFEAPGAAFEPPVTDDGAAESNAVGINSPSSQESAQPEEPKPEEKLPSVATTLLLISPPRVLQLTHLLLLTLPQPEDEPAKSIDAAQAEDAKEPSGTSTKESAKTSDGDKADAAATTSDAAKPDATAKPAAEGLAPVIPAPPERRLLTFAGSRFTLDIKQWPLLGKTDAKYVFVEMFDYTCPHCRNTHHAIAGAQKKYGNDLAIFALPVPLENACNPSAAGGHPGACEMAKIAVAVWRLDPSKFQTFHNWMFQSQRTVSTARAFAETLIDKERLKAELNSDVPGKYISRHVSLYQRVGSGQVPKLIFTNTTMQGEVNSTDTLCNTIKSELATVAKK